VILCNEERNEKYKNKKARKNYKRDRHIKRQQK
jgi:hypothetical protein